MDDVENDLQVNEGCVVELGTTGVDWSCILRLFVYSFVLVTRLDMSASLLRGVASFV